MVFSVLLAWFGWVWVFGWFAAFLVGWYNIVSCGFGVSWMFVSWFWVGGYLASLCYLVGLVGFACGCGGGLRLGLGGLGFACLGGFRVG